ncbi:terpene synthase family protein [Deinococcus koreensis]|uniref:terpene synthase family protein n=1 Tax=Deinococcus koreensis TaxID=2054903 RepID=UPI0013FDAB0F|nr:diguanylate cyclase [Deinococcus koreensis]
MPPSSPNPGPAALKADGGDRLAQIKRRVYLPVLQATLIAVVFTYVIGLRGEPDPFNHLALPLLAVALLSLLLLQLMGRVTVRWIERAFFGVAATAFMAKFVFTVAHSPAIPDAALAQVYIWTPFLYVLAFLIDGSRSAIRRSLVVYVIGVLIGLYGVLSGALSNVRYLLDFYLAGAMILILLYVLATLRHHVSQLQTQVGEMRRLAHLDPLTGVSNRRQLDLQLSQEVLRSERYGSSWSVILFDLDDFKKINDRHGHAAGDEVLRQTAELMQRELRTTDLLGRWGGEEFLILAVQIDLPYARILAERLCRALAAHRMPEVGRVTASFGIATYRTGEGAESLLRRADAALYSAKHAGKNRVEVSLDSRDTPLVLPALQNPFPVAPPAPHEAVSRETSAWLARHGLGPNEDISRGLFATNIVQAVAALHPSADDEGLRLTADWVGLMILHDDRCDSSGIGHNPARLRALTSRLSATLQGQPPAPDDEPLAWAMADLHPRLLQAGGPAWLQTLTRHVDSYFESLVWEADNRASKTIPTLAEYVKMRPLTAGLAIDEAFLEIVDGLRLPPAVRDHPAVQALTMQANRAVCWSNDILSLEKELQNGDVHNLVLVLQQERQLELQPALEMAAGMYHQELERLIDGEQHLPDFGPEVGALMSRYVKLQQLRVGGLLEWTFRSKRYQLGAGLEVPPPEIGPLPSSVQS